MSRPSALLALLLAPWFAGCVGPIACPDGRDPEGVACVCPAPFVEGDDGDCVARTSGEAPSVGRPSADARGTGAGGMRDGGIDLDATLDRSAAERACLPDGGCADAAAPDASR